MGILIGTIYTVSEKYIRRRKFFYDHISGNQICSCPGNPGFPGESYRGGRCYCTESRWWTMVHRDGGSALRSQHGTLWGSGTPWRRAALFRAGRAACREKCQRKDSALAGRKKRAGSDRNRQISRGTGRHGEQGKSGRQCHIVRVFSLCQSRGPGAVHAFVPLCGRYRRPSASRAHDEYFKRRKTCCKYSGLSGIYDYACLCGQFFRCPAYLCGDLSQSEEITSGKRPFYGCGGWRRFCAGSAGCGKRSGHAGGCDQCIRI